MGALMNHVLGRAHNKADPLNEIRESLRRIHPHCCWTHGAWEGLNLKWNEVQSVPTHINKLSDLLVYLDFALSQKAA